MMITFVKMTVKHNNSLNLITGCLYTGCPGRNVPDFGRMFLKLKYTDLTPKHLYPKLNGYGDNGERKVWSSCGSTYRTWFA